TFWFSGIREYILLNIKYKEKNYKQRGDSHFLRFNARQRFGYVECGTLKHFPVKLPLSQFVYSYFLFTPIVKDELAVLQRRTAVELPAETRITYSFCWRFVVFLNLFHFDDF
ncbi:MAG: hypothetical protein WC240_06835, partial [Bacilli bacterium]